MTSEKIDLTPDEKFLETANFGSLTRFKKLAKQLDVNGKGIVETVANVRNHHGLSSLHYAALNGQLELLKYMIDDLKLDVDTRTYKDGTPLLYACLGGQFEAAVYLLEKGANPNIQDNIGVSPLHNAAFQGNIDLLNLLLSRNVDVDVVSVHGTPLLRAAAYGKHDAVKVLLDHHANPNLSPPPTRTPIFASVLAGSLPCLKLLAEAGADPNAGLCDEVPLVLAALKRDTEMIRCLLKAGADANVCNQEGLKPIEIAALGGNQQDFEILSPMTLPIPTYADWSFRGICRHVHSVEITEKRDLKSRENFAVVKSQGQDAFRKKDYVLAMNWYTRAISLDVSDATVLSNRSLCWARLKEGENAVSDANECIRLKPYWSKGYYRAGAAWTILEDFDQAARASRRALELEPENKELKKAFQEAEAKRRQGR